MSTSSQPPSLFQIDATKITAYLLNPVHVSGGAKAGFFIAQGFSTSRPHELADALLSHPLASTLVNATNNGFVDKFIYEGALAGPKGPIRNIRSVWKVDRAHTHAELVTAYRA